MKELLTNLLNLNECEYEILMEWIDEVFSSDEDVEKFVEFVQDQSKELEIYLWELDICALFYEFACQEANVPELIEVLLADGCDTRFEISNKEAIKILEDVPEEDRNQYWYFLLESF